MKKTLFFIFAASVTVHAVCVGNMVADTLAVAEPDHVFAAEQMPSFEGGYLGEFQKWVVSQVGYSAELMMDGIEGTVIVTFVV